MAVPSVRAEVARSKYAVSDDVSKRPQTELVWQRGQLGTTQRVGKPEHPCYSMPSSKEEVLDALVINSGDFFPRNLFSTELHHTVQPNILYI